MTSHRRLLPLLVYYLIVVLVGARERFEGDEQFYLQYARDLLALLTGRGAALDLGTGPGYPLALIPFVVAGVPPLGIKLLNAVCLFGAVVCMHATLRLYLSPRRALGFAALFGVYPPLLKESFFVLSECWAMLLMCAFVYLFCRLHRAEGRWAGRAVLTGAVAALLVLTKVFFSYVFLLLLVGSGVLWLWRRRPALRNTAVVAAVALALCTPYLAYTYAVTGRVFYWAYTGGEALYWMSTPYAGEYGEWHPDHFRGIDRIRANHEEFFAGLPEGRQAREPALRQKAVEQIRAHPRKFLLNWAANMGRMVFSYPYSYRLQTPLTFLLLLPNTFIFVLSVLCVYPSLRAWRRLPAEMIVLLCFAALAFGGASLLAAYERQFRALVPILGLWIAYTLTQILRIEMRGTDGERAGAG